MEDEEVIEGNEGEEIVETDEEKAEEKELTVEELKAQLAKETAEKEKRKGRFKSNAAKTKGNEGKDVEEIVQQKLEQAKVGERIDFVKSQIPAEYLEAFETEFTELSGGKELTLANVDKFLKSAVTLSVPQDKGYDIEQVKAGATSGGVAGGKAGGSKSNKEVEAGMQILKDQGIL